MAQTVTEELALIIKTQSEQAVEALREYEEVVKKATEAMSKAGEASDKTSEAANKSIDTTEQATQALQEHVETVDKAAESLLEVGTATEQASQATVRGAEANKQATETEVSKASAVDKSYNSYMKLVGAYAAVAIVVAKGIRLYKDLAAEGEVNVLASAKLEAVYRATGRAADFSFNQVERWALELRKTTGIAEAETVSMTASLSAFKNIGNEIMPRVLENSANLSALWGTDVTSSAKKLGRALEDPLKGMTLLQESGVVLDKESQQLITTLMEQGKVTEAQGILLNALDTRVGGLATSMHSALGPVGDLRATLAEIKGDIGEDLLRIPGLEMAVRALDGYLDKRRNKRDLSELFVANRDGSINDMLKGMDSEELELQIDIVTTSKSSDVAPTFQRNFESSKKILLTLLEEQLEAQRKIEGVNAEAARKAAENARQEEKIVGLILEQQVATKTLKELYVNTDEGRKTALEEQIELIKKQKTEDEELLTAEAYINQYGTKENIARLNEAKTRLQYYDAIIQGKQDELAGLNKIEVKEDYLGKLLGGVTASDYVLDIPLSFDFGRTQKQELEEQLSGLKGQINNLWSAGPAADDAGEWQAALDLLSGKYDSIGAAVATITEQETAASRAKELLLTLVTEEQAALKKKLDYQQELEKLEAEGLITAEQRQELWDKEYAAISKVKTVSQMTDEEFKKMGETLSKQLFNAEAMGSTLSSMFSDLGSTLAEGGNGIDSLVASSGQFAQQIMGQISQMALASGLRILAETGIAGLPVALGLFALGGIAGISSGLMGGSGSGLDGSLMKSIDNETKARQKLADSINKTIDTEYDLLKRQLDRNLISVEDFKAQAGAMQAQRNFADAKAALSNAASGKMSGIGSELSGMSGWQKFWSGKDEDLEKQAAQIQSLFKAIESVTDTDQLRRIKSQLEDLGVSTGDVPAFAKGGEFMTSGPQLIKVGDNPGGVEHIRITPVSSGDSLTAGRGNQIININGDVYGIDDLYGKLQQAGVKLGRKKIS